MSSSDNFIVAFALIIVLVSAVSFGVVYYSVSDLKSSVFTGFATQTNATINITVMSNIAINFTTNSINFGQGNVNSSFDQATLDSGLGTAVNGSWAMVGVNRFLVLENIGTANVTLNIATLKNATQFIGGQNPWPKYQYNITNGDGSNPCTAAPGFSLGVWNDVNTSVPGTLVCSSFRPDLGNNLLNISVRLVVPYNSLNGSLTDVMMATASST